MVCRRGRDARFSWKQRRNVVSSTQCFLSVDLDQELGLNCLSCDRRLEHRITRILGGFILSLLDVTPGILEGKGRLVGWSACSTGRFHFLQPSNPDFTSGSQSSREPMHVIPLFFPQRKPRTGIFTIRTCFMKKTAVVRYGSVTASSISILEGDDDRHLLGIFVNNVISQIGSESSRCLFLTEPQTNNHSLPHHNTPDWGFLILLPPNTNSFVL